MHGLAGMQPAGQVIAAPLQALLDGALDGTWDLDPRASRILMKTRVLGGIGTVRGVFREVSGTGTVSPDGQVTGTVTVAAASVDTRNAKRDTHLRSAEILDVRRHADITCTVSGVRLSGPGAVLTGALTIHGRTRPVSVDAAVSVRGDGEIWLDAAIGVSRADFGMTWNVLGMASMRSTAVIHAVFTRRRPRPGGDG